MKRFLYVFLTVLMASSAMANELELTESPVIQITENQDGITITVQGNGMLNVRVMRDNDYDHVFNLLSMKRRSRAPMFARFLGPMTMALMVRC